MEAIALADMFRFMYDERKCLVVTIVTDDDSKMKAAMRWSNEDHEKHYGVKPYVYSKTSGKRRIHRDCGLLRYSLRQPGFLSDKAHRKKGFTGKVYCIFNGPVAGKHGMIEVDIIRVTTNFAFMARQLSSMEKSLWISAARSVVDHHFDCHDNCGSFVDAKMTVQK